MRPNLAQLPQTSIRCISSNNTVQRRARAFLHAPFSSWNWIRSLDGKPDAHVEIASNWIDRIGPLSDEWVFIGQVVDPTVDFELTVHKAVGCRDIMDEELVRDTSGPILRFDSLNFDVAQTHLAEILDPSWNGPLV